ncbi:MAG: thioredoxin family protein [Burkholderiales bacterium]|nr:thioredoxin family protein [Burkholderiales bacterium]
MELNKDIIAVTEANYEDTVVDCPKTVLLDIGAPWCQDCRRIEPLFKEFATKYHDKLQFAYCDFDKEAGLNTKFQIRHIPTLLVIKNGKILDTLVEPKNVELFEKFVQKALTLS